MKWTALRLAQLTSANSLLAPLPTLASSSDRSLSSTGASVFTAVLGKNYRVQGDVVSARATSSLGHYGDRITIDVPGITEPAEAHDMGVFLSYLLQSSEGARDPFQS